MQHLQCACLYSSTQGAATGHTIKTTPQGRCLSRTQDIHGLAGFGNVVKGNRVLKLVSDDFFLSGSENKENTIHLSLQNNVINCNSTLIWFSYNATGKIQVLFKEQLKTDLNLYIYKWQLSEWAGFNV